MLFVMLFLFVLKVLVVHLPGRHYKELMFVSSVIIWRFLVLLILFEGYLGIYFCTGCSHFWYFDRVQDKE